MNQRKKDRQARAAQRQAERDQRDNVDQIRLILERRGQSGKEFLRLWQGLSIKEQDKLVAEHDHLRELQGA